MSILSKISKAVRSLTSEKANEDLPPNVDTPSSPSHDAVPMPEREPAVGFEPDAES